MDQNTPIAPPFDPELIPALDATREVIRPYTAESLPSMREVISAGVPGLEPTDWTAGGRILVSERTVPGPEGDPDITLVILQPAEGQGPWPGIYQTHGGGMIVGDRYTEIPPYLKYVAEGLAVLVSVEYRLAPEHPDPAPVEDCYAGLVWTVQHAEELGIDPGRLMITGSSAGGGLAAGTALLARDRGYPALSHQILTCPMLDDRLQTHSSRMLDGSGIWDRNDNHFGWSSLLGDRRGGAEVSIYAAPARAEDLSRLPKTYIDTGSAEGFRDEAIDYALRLSQAGVSVDFHMWAGGFHGFDISAPHAAVSQASLWVRENFIRRALS